MKSPSIAMNPPTEIVLSEQFEKSLKGTSLENESRLRTLMLLLADNPNSGRTSRLHSDIRTIEFAGHRVFFATVAEKIILLSVDSDGPENARSSMTVQILALALGLVASLSTILPVLIRYLK